MRAMVLDAPGRELREAEVPAPELRPGQVRIRVGACGVCRTDLHIRDGELPEPKLPLILGHQIVGTVVEGETGFRRRRPRRRSLARLDVRRVPLLPRRTGEPVRPRPLHRLHAGRWLRRGGRCGCPLLLPASRGAARRGARAAPLCGADRLSGAPGGRRRRVPRPLRLRRGGAHHRAGRDSRGPSCLRLHPAGRRRGTVTGSLSLAPSGRERSASGPRSSTPRSSSRLPVSSSRKRWPRSERAAPWSAPGST